MLLVTTHLFAALCLFHLLGFFSFVSQNILDNVQRQQTLTKQQPERTTDYITYTPQRVLKYAWLGLIPI